MALDPDTPLDARCHRFLDRALVSGYSRRDVRHQVARLGVRAIPTIDKGEASDPKTVVFRLQSATAAFLPALADPISAASASPLRNAIGSTRASFLWHRLP